jgi:hypothetical protein
MRNATTGIRQETVMGTHTAHKPSQMGNLPASFAPLLFADPSYFDATRAPARSAGADGYRFIARLGEIFRARA